MIYCPQCGTANKPNSKFCKNCAALLAPSTDVRCPICGTMNPAGAATCSNCDTRLTTTSATPSDRTTPADTPENITPFTPPDTAPEDDDSDSARTISSSSARPSFSRSSSEWLRRVQKTPPPDSSSNSAAAAMMAAAALADTTNLSSAPGSAQAPARTEQDEIPEWLREIQNEANAQAAAEAAAAADAVKTDSNNRFAAVAAAGVAAADQFSEHSTNGSAESGVPQLETPTPAKPQLSEIKLTGDDYDYSDIGGTVTPEMQAALEANADKLQSVDDETALARKLLGLDVDEPAAITGETSDVAPLAVGVVAASSLLSDAAIADVTQAAAQEEEGHSAAKIIAGVAAAGTVAARMLGSEDDSAKPEASEAQAVAAADSAAEVEGALPTALSGEAAPLEQADTDLEATAPVTVVAAEQSNVQEPDDDQTPGWVTALAAASSAAVVAAAVSDKRDDEMPQATAQEDTASDIPPALAVVATAAALDATSDTLSDKSTPPPLETGEMPDWLKEIAPEEITGTKPLTPEEEDALPAWVQELAPTAVGLGTVAYLSQLPELDEEERGDLPDWLREPVAPEPDAAEVLAAAALAEGVSGDAPLELPSWFSDPAVTGSAHDPFEVVEMTGPLAGISGILPLALAITEPHTLTTPMPARSDGGRIFQTLLAEPLASSARTETTEKSKALFTVNHVLYLLIFLAALIPLFFGLEQAGLGLNAVESGTALFYDELQAVPANGTTVLAFEYTAGSAVELDPAARAIVDDLAKRQVNVIALTSNPNGVTLAENILQRAKETHPDFTYVNVGYIPGNDAGLRALASGWLPASRQDVNGVPWGATPLGGAVRNMDELALTVLIVGDDLTLRNWMEQVQPRITSPMIAATSAMLEPQARNYVNASQLQASLRGLTGAAELELLSNQAGQAVKTVDAFSVVSLVLAGIIIVGNIMLLARRKK